MPHYKPQEASKRHKIFAKNEMRVMMKIIKKAGRPTTTGQPAFLIFRI
ncbi:hypothetical protein B739_0489 [Riemerella anatipestifer RA-CH-1]|uniref:Uncharacterized protein n=1 Tax=Riemerella anatipestifer RA-CH-1 TaxID=1228997 RepID=J9R3U2_RIEAN|nr:hypothetical protein B739_0489 [Riemerella anatipestifer RA-CH-1]AIH02108.1 hypothetical protein M949_0939 [Riemerella anatipestifer CH3]